MSASVRRLAVCRECCAVGLAISPVTALGGRPSSEVVASGEGIPAPSSPESSLVTAGSPIEAEQVQAQEEAKRSSPEAAAEREAPQTEFEGLDTERAAKVAGSTPASRRRGRTDSGRRAMNTCKSEGQAR